MSGSDDRLGQDNHRELQEEDFPFIEDGAEPPGRFVPFDPSDPGTGSWEGPIGWRTRHGLAIVRWDLGKPRKVTDALLTNGVREEIDWVADHGYRRRSSGNTRWVYGTIAISADDVTFTDSAAQPSYTPPAPTAEPDLEIALANDDAILNALRDDCFAQAAHAALCNREFVRSSDLAIWACGERRAASLVAELRGFGESYLDWYWRVADTVPQPVDQAPQVSEPLVRISSNEENPFYTHLARLGWRPLSVADERRLGAEAMRRGLEILREIKTIEAQPVAMPEEWVGTRMRSSMSLKGFFLAKAMQSITNDERSVLLGLGQRIDGLAESGRISEQAFDAMMGKIIAIDARLHGYAGS